MYEVLIALRSVGPGRVVLTTNTTTPQVGRKLTHPEALALDMITFAQRQTGCDRVEWESPLLDADNSAAQELVSNLLNPDEFGYSVTPEVRNAARRVLGVKGKMEGLAA